MSDLSRFLAEQQDTVSHPSHYTSGQIECKDAMKSAFGQSIGLPAMAFYWWGCAFKYLWRWRYKSGLTDLEKCKQCIDYLIKEMQENEETDGTKWYARPGFLSESRQKQDDCGNRE